MNELRTIVKQIIKVEKKTNSKYEDNPFFDEPTGKYQKNRNVFRFYAPDLINSNISSANSYAMNSLFLK